MIAYSYNTKVVEAKANRKGQLKLQFRAGLDYYCITLQIASFGGMSKTETPMAALHCGIIGKVRTSRKRMKL